MTENDVARLVVNAAFKVHRALGPGLLESVYQAVLEYELVKQGLGVVSQVALPVIYDSVVI